MKSEVGVMTLVLRVMREKKKKKLTLRFECQTDHKADVAGKGKEAALEDSGA